MKELEHMMSDTNLYMGKDWETSQAKKKKKYIKMFFTVYFSWVVNFSS